MNFSLYRCSTEFNRHRILYANVFVFFGALIFLGNNLFNKPMLMLMCIFYLNANLKQIPRILSSLSAIWPLLLLMVWATLSLQWSEYPLKTRDSLQVQWSFLMAFVLLYTAVPIDKIIQSLCSISRITVIINFIYSTVFFGQARSPIGLRGLYGHKNALGVIMMFCILILFTNTKKWKFDRRIIVAAFILLVLSNSKTSFVLTISSVMLLYILRKIKKPIKLHFNRVFLFIGGVLGVVLFRVRIIDFLLQNIPENAFTGRGAIWLTIFSHFRNDMFKGVGLSAFWNVGDYNRMQYTDIYYEHGSWIRVLAGADNGYVDIAITLGFVGLALVLGLFLYNFQTIFKKGFSEDSVRYAFIFCFIPFIHNFMESTILLSTNIVWFSLIFGTLCAHAESFDKYWNRNLPTHWNHNNEK